MIADEMRGPIDAALCKIGDAKPSDVLVIRFDQSMVTTAQAHRFAEALCEAVSTLPEEVRKTLPRLPLVFAPDGISWSIERAPADPEMP